jgi:hypothetical protein
MLKTLTDQTHPQSIRAAHNGRPVSDPVDVVRSASVSARMIGPDGHAAVTAAAATITPARTKAQGIPPGWSTRVPAAAPPAALAATGTVAIHVYASVSMSVGTTRPTREM